MYFQKIQSNKKKLKNNIKEYDIDKYYFGTFMVTYSREDDDIFEELYEELGTFSKVAERYSELYKKSPNKDTIINRLEKKFKREGRDFKLWAKKHYKGRLPFTSYSVEDDIIFMQLYEKYGSFKKVVKKYKEIYRDSHKGKGPKDETIIQRLKNKFLSENKDFAEWVKKFRKRGFTIVEKNDDKSGQYKKRYDTRVF